MGLTHFCHGSFSISKDAEERKHLVYEDCHYS